MDVYNCTHTHKNTCNWYKIAQKHKETKIMFLKLSIDSLGLQGVKIVQCGGNTLMFRALHHNQIIGCDFSWIDMKTLLETPAPPLGLVTDLASTEAAISFSPRSLEAKLHQTCARQLRRTFPGWLLRVQKGLIFLNEAFPGKPNIGVLLIKKNTKYQTKEP